MEPWPRELHLQHHNVVEDCILYQVEPDDTLRVVPPLSQRQNLFQRAHCGVFGAHLSDIRNLVDITGGL